MKDEESPTLLEVDGRRRISLGALAEHKYYLTAVDPDGVIVLTPAVVVPAGRFVRGTTPPAPQPGGDRLTMRYADMGPEAGRQ